MGVQSVILNKLGSVDQARLIVLKNKQKAVGLTSDEVDEMKALEVKLRAVV